MSDLIGRVSVPAIVNSGLNWPALLAPRYPTGFSVDWPVITHRFGSLDAKQEQRYVAGVGPRKIPYQKPNLNYAERNTLRDFWESMQGPWKAFTYPMPNADGSTTHVTVTFEEQPLNFAYLRSSVQAGLNLVEWIDPATAPVWAVAATCLRFPSEALTEALLAQTQQIVPLVHIKVREAGVPEIYLSDRRCTVGGQLYLPRLVGIGEAGSDVILTQDMRGTADSLRLTFGNADRVMTALANDTNLSFASIDLSLYHVNSGILLQLWKGVIPDGGWRSDGTAVFPLQCSGGFFQMMNQYPPRQADRCCWKPFDDGVLCPYATQGSGGDPAECDYYFDSVKGCESHGMTKYFGGLPAAPQGVTIKDDSTGTWGIGRNTVTATSIISESLWGTSLAEIWCHSGGDATKAFLAAALIAAYRDESTFADALGAIGAGPLGGFTPMQVAANQDGYRYVVAPMLDGVPPQGFKIDGNLNIKDFQPGMGLRFIGGSDPVNPATDSFSLGDGTPQRWGPQMAAGVAGCEIRISKDAKINPSTPEQHQMTVPVDYGLWGWTWDAAGNRTAVKGLVNPFWIAVNMLLRILGLYGDPATGTGPNSATQLGTFVLNSLTAGDGSGAAEIAAAIVPAILGGGVEQQFQFQGSLSQRKPFHDWLNEVLSETALGFFTWEFGKLKLGIRSNASVVDAYTVANTLFQSLILEPIQAEFEGVELSFADVAYQYQANTAKYVDKSHAAAYGRSSAPLVTQKHSVGCSTLSQGLRLAATVTREVIGGVKLTEWRDARRAAWKTTLLGLGNAVGQVVSQTAADIPGLHGTGTVAGTTLTPTGGDPLDAPLADKELLLTYANGTSVQVLCSGVNTDGNGNVTGLALAAAPGDGAASFRAITMAFRLQRWSLMKDWSVQLEGQTVTESMYDLEVGPKPADVAPRPLPALLYPIPLGPAWAPYQVQAAANDALFPGEWTFDADQEY